MSVNSKNKMLIWTLRSGFIFLFDRLYNIVNEGIKQFLADMVCLDLHINAHIYKRITSIYSETSSNQNLTDKFNDVDVPKIIRS